MGTGAYTEREYAEAVFALRDPHAVRHQGRRVDEKDSPLPRVIHGGSP